jgi:hypothetical protein
MTLDEGRANFVRLGASNARLRQLVRDPRPWECPPPGGLLGPPANDGTEGVARQAVLPNPPIRSVIQDCRSDPGLAGYPALLGSS